MANETKNSRKKNSNTGYNSESQIRSSQLKREFSKSPKIPRKRLNCRDLEKRIQYIPTSSKYISDSEFSSDSSFSLETSYNSMQESAESKYAQNSKKSNNTHQKYDLDKSSGSQTSYNSSQTVDEAESDLKLLYSPSECINNLIYDLAELESGASFSSKDQSNNSQLRSFRTSYESIITPDSIHNFDGQFQFNSCFSSGSISINQKILKLQQLSSSNDKFGQLAILQEINQYFLMGYDENLASVNFRGLVTCLIGIIDCSSQSSIEVESFYDENTLVELKSIAIGLLIHLIEGVPRTVGDLLAPVIPLLLSTMSNSFIADILDRMLSLLDHLSRNYPKHILRCGGLQTVLGFYDFVTASQHRTILNLVNNCSSSLTIDDVPTVLECLPQLVVRFRDPEPRCVEKVCQCFLKILSCYQNNQDVIDKIANAPDFLDNIQYLLLSTPPVLSNNLDLIQILTIITRSSSSLAIKLIQSNLVDTIKNFVSDFIQVDENTCVFPSDYSAQAFTKPQKSVIQEEIQAVVSLISHLMPESNCRSNLPESFINPENNDGYYLRSTSTPEAVPSSSSGSGKLSRYKSKKRNSHAALPSSKRVAVNEKTKDVKRQFFSDQIDKFEAKLSSLTKDEKSKLDLSKFTAINSINRFLPILLKIYHKFDDEKSRLKCLTTIEDIFKPLKTCTMDLIVDNHPKIYSLVSNIMTISYKDLLESKAKHLSNRSSPQIFYIALKIINLLCDKMPNYKTAFQMRKQGILYFINRFTSDTDLIHYLSQIVSSEINEINEFSQRNKSVTLRGSFNDEPKIQNRNALSFDGAHQSLEEFRLNSNPESSDDQLAQNIRKKNDLHLKDSLKVHSTLYESRKKSILEICNKVDCLMNEILLRNKNDLKEENNELKNIDLLPKISELARKISSNSPKKWQEAIKELAFIFSSNTKPNHTSVFPSPFELEHSGLLTALFNYFSPDENNESNYCIRMRIFRDHFFPDLFSDFSFNHPRFLAKRLCNCAKNYNHLNDPCELCECQIEYINLGHGKKPDLKISSETFINPSQGSSFKNMIQSLLNCLHQHDSFDLFIGTEFLLASGHSSLVNLHNIQSSQNQIYSYPFSLSLDSKSQIGYRLTHSLQDANCSIAYNVCTGNTISQLAAKTNALSNSPLNSLGGLLKVDLIREPSADAEIEKIFLKNSYWSSLIHPLSLKVPATYTIKQLQSLLINRVYLMNNNKPVVSSSRFDKPVSHLHESNNVKCSQSGISQGASSNLIASSSSSYRGIKSFMNKTRKSSKSVLNYDTESPSDKASPDMNLVNYLPTSELSRRNSSNTNQFNESPPGKTSIRLLRSHLGSIKKTENLSTDEINPKRFSMRIQNPTRSFPEQNIAKFLSSDSPQAENSGTDPKPIQQSSYTKHQVNLGNYSPKKNKISLLAAINKISNHVNTTQTFSSSHNETTPYSYNSPRSYGRKKERHDKSKLQSVINGIFDSHESFSPTNLHNHYRGITKKAISSMIHDKLEPVFYLDGERLDGEMPLFQALRSKMPTRVIESDLNHTQADIINVFMWSKSHLLSYKLVYKDNQDDKRKLKPECTSKVSSKKAKLTRSSGTTSPKVLSCDNSSVKFKDPLCNYVCKTSKEKRILKSLGSLEYNNGIEKKILEILKYFSIFNQEWAKIDGHLNNRTLVNENYFTSLILSNKIYQQLNDVYSLLTGNWPIWLIQMIKDYPFLFTFSVRQAFFYAYNFNRNRLLLRLSENQNLNEFRSSSGPSSPLVQGHHFRQIMVLSSLKDLSCNQFLNQNSIKVIESLLVTHSINSFPYVPSLSSLTSNTSNPRGIHSPSVANDSRNRLSQFASSMFGLQGNSPENYPTISSKPSDNSNNEISPMSTELINSSNKFKACIDRKSILKHAIETFELMDNSQSFLEIAFNDEAGFGVGPTLEFYTLVSHKLQEYYFKLWHGNEVDSGDNYLVPKHGLFPRPCKSPSKENITIFTFIGRLMARSLLDGRQLDLPLSSVLYKSFIYGGKTDSFDVSDLELVDHQLAKQINYLISMANMRSKVKSQLSFKTEDSSRQNENKVLSLVNELDKIDEEINSLCLTFTLPGYDEYELIDNGKSTEVSGTNLSLYIKSIIDNFLYFGVKNQMEALINGFDGILPNSRSIIAKLFSPKELDLLFCGNSMESWDIENLKNSCKYDHGYTIRSRSIQFLFEIITEFSDLEKRLFIQFITGSPRLPIGGFKALKPPLKIVLKYEAKDNVDSHLPSVMTCQNYLKLPDYSTKEVMREKLIYAIYEGQNAFLLS